MVKMFVVRLSLAERETLNDLIKKQRVAAQRVLRAQVLLKADVNGPSWTDAKIAEAFDCQRQTIEKIRERFVVEGFDVTINGKPKRRVRGKILDGEQEAKIIALRLGPPPKGFANWTLRLLAERAVALEIAESVSYETVRRTLKKTEGRTARSSIGSFHPRPMRSSPRAWRRSWKSMPGLTIRNTLCCAWTSSRFNF
jgi:hypothetical protein